MKIEFDDKEVLAMFEKIANEVPKAMKDIVSNAGAVALTEARNKVPVDTGALKGSLTLEVDLNGDTPSATVGTNLEYAPAVEYGTSRHRPQPFMRPAEEMAKNKMNEIAKAVLKSL